MIQKAAIAALDGPLDMVEKQCREYEKRRDALCGGFRQIGWDVPDSQGTMFVWAPIPDQFSSSEQFCMKLMEQTGVICTPEILLDLLEKVMFVLRSFCLRKN